MTTSRQWRLAARPVGDIKTGDFELVDVPIPEPADGQIVVAVTHISIDPAMRGWMNAGRSYIPPVEIGEVMRALTLGVVISSRKKQFAEGELVHGTFGVAEHAVSDGAGVHRITPADGLSRATYLGVLGMTGMTAYFGLLDVGRLQPGDTVLVSGAAGAVGTTVGQIAKTKGTRVIGSQAVSRNVPSSSTSGSTPSWITNTATSGNSCASTPRIASTCFSTTSVATCSTKG